MKLLSRMWSNEKSQQSSEEQLFDACVKGDLEAFKQALKIVGDINHMITDQNIAERYGNNASTPLLIVAFYEGCTGHEEIFDYIIAQPETNLKAVDKNGNSAISYCVYKERADRLHKLEAAIERQEKAVQAKAKKPINPNVPK